MDIELPITPMPIPRQRNIIRSVVVSWSAGIIDIEKILAMSVPIIPDTFV